MRHVGNILASGLTALAIGLGPASAKDLIVPFADEAAQDAAFLAYRDALVAAIAARDAEAVAGMADAEIVLSFGDDGGREVFYSWLTEGPWDGFEPAEDFWRELETVLALGGRFDGPEVFSAPYYWSAELPETLDPYATYIVIADGTPMLSAPAPDAKVLAGLPAGAVVETVADDWDQPFHLIRRADGSQGYMAAADLRALIDYRAIFERGKGGWRMTIFVAGD